MNSVAFVPASPDFPHGLVIAGGRDAIIEVRQLGKQPQDNADALLLGHVSNVCALDVSEDGKVIVSGSWDTEARVWQVGKWESPAVVLRGHSAAVWAVSFYDKNTILTGKPKPKYPAWPCVTGSLINLGNRQCRQEHTYLQCLRQTDSQTPTISGYRTSIVQVALGSLVGCKFRSSWK